MSDRADYRRALVAAGLCRDCKAPRENYAHRCDACAERDRDYQRRRLRAKRGSKVVIV